MACPCSWGWFAESVFSHAWKTISNSHRTAPWSQLKQKIYIATHPFKILMVPIILMLWPTNSSDFSAQLIVRFLGGQWISESGFTWLALQNEYNTHPPVRDPLASIFTLWELEDMNRSICCKQPDLGFAELKFRSSHISFGFVLFFL